MAVFPMETDPMDDDGEEKEEEEEEEGRKLCIMENKIWEGICSSHRRLLICTHYYQVRQSRHLV
jgi:hypothetical protein